MGSVGLLLVLVVLFWLWYSGARAKETAIHCVKAACEETGVQLLDATIFLKKLWPARLQNGRVGLLRFYQFDYTENGANRFQGLIVMTSNRMEYLQMEKDGHTVVTTGDNSN